MEELWNKLQNGLKDYCQKNGFKKVVLGLSGGIDSALTAVLAADALGGENVKAIMMKTQYTSQLSLDIARQIASLNRLDYQELDIEPLVQTHCRFLKTAFKETVKGIVIENLQARLRGQILMAYSNQNGGLVLACGNRSEALTGYCTLYGDTCGGLAPIGNLYKTTVFELAQWRNAKGFVLPADVITRAPSAELAKGQKDENSLPPYEELDAILKRLVDKKMSPRKIVSDGYSKTSVERVQNLVAKSAFKRAQMARALAV